MAQKPEVSLRKKIRIGPGGLVTAVVSSLSALTQNGDCEVVYLDDYGRALSSDVRWTGSCWEFVGSGDGYADHFDRLRPYVQILRPDSEKKVIKNRPPKGRPRTSRR